ncbi:unnamed protein product, partial [Discosporangium mesarthrocarpum]
QVVVVPIINKPGPDTDLVNEAVDKIVEALRSAGIRVKVDDRPNMRPGAKYFEWEAKGVPLRVELGPRDAKGGAAIIARRTGGDKLTVPTGEGFVRRVKEELDTLQNVLWEEASSFLASRWHGDVG